MSRSFFYTLQGGDKLLQILRNYPETVRRTISQQFEISAQDIRTKAVERVQNRIAGEFDHFTDPKYFGPGLGEIKKEQAENDLIRVGQSINYKKVDDLTYEIIAGAATSAYFEFGTGEFVFDGENWVDGDLREYARNFFVNGKGKTKPHPFLFNSFYEERVELIKRLKEKLGAR